MSAQPVGDVSIASLLFPWYDEPMETTPFDLTPEQKGMLASLSRETGKPIPALIAEALKELETHERAGHPNGERHAGKTSPADARPRGASLPFWQRFLEVSRRIPDEELDQLPPDLAAQVDHYIYGTPKR
jgi:hypothetical protein